MKSFLIAVVLSILALPALAEWKYKTTKDHMADSVINSAMVTSSNKLQFGFPYGGGTTGLFTIRKKHENGEIRTSIILSISKGQILESEGATIRIDDDQAIYLSGSHPSDGSSDYLFLDFPAKISGCVASDTPAVKGESSSEWTRRYEENKGACEITDAQFIAKLLSSLKLRVQATFYNEGAGVFEFKTKGMKPVE